MQELEAAGAKPRQALPPEIVQPNQRRWRVTRWDESPVRRRRSTAASDSGESRADVAAEALGSRFPQLLRPDREWDDIMRRSDRPRHADTFSSSPSDGYSPWPITSGELASLVDLGLSDNRIARYFGVEPVKVSALRDYYGLVDAEHP